MHASNRLIIHTNVPLLNAFEDWSSSNFTAVGTVNISIDGNDEINEIKSPFTQSKCVEPIIQAKWYVALLYIFSGGFVVSWTFVKNTLGCFDFCPIVVSLYTNHRITGECRLRYTCAERYFPSLPLTASSICFVEVWAEITRQSSCPKLFQWFLSYLLTVRTVF